MNYTRPVSPKPRRRLDHIKLRCNTQPQRLHQIQIGRQDPEPSLLLAPTALNLSHTACRVCVRRQFITLLQQDMANRAVNVAREQQTARPAPAPPQHPASLQKDRFRHRTDRRGRVPAAPGVSSARASRAEIDQSVPRRRRHARARACAKHLHSSAEVGPGQCSQHVNNTKRSDDPR